MPAAGLFAWLRALGNSRKCHFPRVPRPGGRGVGGGSRAANRHSAPSPPPAASPERASERSAPHERLTPRFRNPSLLVSGTSCLRNPSSLASGTPHPASPSGRARLLPGEWEAVAVPSPLCRSVTSQPQQSAMLAQEGGKGECGGC